MEQQTSIEPFGQRKYQVRLDVGAAGARRILPGAHLVVLVDALSFTTAVVVAAEHGVPVAPAVDRISAGVIAARLGGLVAGRRGESGATLSPASYAGFAAALAGEPAPIVVLDSPNGGGIAAELAEEPVVVLAAAMRNRAAVARRILAIQEERGERLVVAIVAAGERDEATGAPRPAIEDQLVAGAVVDALVGLGIDHTSPEAAVACAAFEGLARATTHLIAAAGSAVELVGRGFRDDVRLAVERDASEIVPELVDGVFRA